MYSRWIQEGFTVEPPGKVRGPIFSEMNRVSVPESQSYRPKVGLQTKRPGYSRGDAPESEPNWPEKQPESGVGASTDNPP